MVRLSYKLYAFPKRYEFFKNKIDFLGMLIGENFILVNPNRSNISISCPRPSYITDIRSFLGLLQFFRRLIPNFEKFAAPLTDLTKKKSCVPN